ncbi:MAG TPA: hypothetical protein VHQ87_11360 [Rhizobacter sp.]|nr:hypothetical protein [Rhizobacter sp.]
MLSCLARGGGGLALSVLVLLGACSPTLDWREVRPEGSEVVALFPCKPSTDARSVTLDGARVRMLLTSCRAADVNWALAYADVPDPSRVPAALAALRAALEANLGGPAQRVSALQVNGMTPNPLAERVRIQGKLPAGDAVVLEGGFFAKGPRVFQATAMGANLSADAVANFFENLKLPS